MSPSLARRNVTTANDAAEDARETPLYVRIRELDEGDAELLDGEAVIAAQRARCAKKS